MKDKSKKKAEIITAVTSPLGFFVLVILVVEGIFCIIIASINSGFDRTFLIIGMICLMFLLILTVSGMAIYRPYSLYGPIKITGDKIVNIDLRRSIGDCLKFFKKTLVISLNQEIKFRLNFLRFDQKNSKLVMYVQDDVYQDKDFEIKIEAGIKKGIIICETVQKGKLISRNLSVDHYTFYSDSPIRETLSSVMAFPLRNSNGNIIAIIALDSDKKVDELVISEDKLKDLFLNLCSLIENILKDAGINNL